jgi:predicted ATP-grasp superfamily ATP-dependent carboligase
MRIFLYEFTCSPVHDLHQAWQPLRAEGRAMLAALSADFKRVPGVEVITLPSQTSPQPGADDDHLDGQEEAIFRRLARLADYTLVVAPESDGILRTRCRWVEDAGGRLLGPSSVAVELAGDKLALAEHLRGHGVPTPSTWAWRLPGPPGLRFPAVWKPRDGTGSQATFLAATPQELAACAARARDEGWRGRAVVQPFAPGRPASVAFLIGPAATLALPPASQALSGDGRFHYRGGTVPLPPALAERAVRVGRQAVGAVPGLRGYVGVDVVLGEPADGSADWVIEVNPRLTTSYVGLRALAQGNLAEVMLRAVQGQPVPALPWRDGAVHFYPDGRVSA